MTNSKLLRALIDSKGLKLKYVAEQLGLSAYGFQNKVDNKTEFKSGEIATLCKLLEISSLKKKEEIFFAPEDDLKSSKGAK